MILTKEEARRKCCCGPPAIVYALTEKKALFCMAEECMAWVILRANCKDIKTGTIHLSIMAEKEPKLYEMIPEQGYCGLVDES